MAVASPANTQRNFSRVVLTSNNVFISAERLANTPSMQDGLDADTEGDLRNYGCELIQTAGILLRLPQVAMATGQVLFQRYYHSRSFVRHNMEITAIAAVHLASKIEEAPRRIRDCLNVFHHMKQVKTGQIIGPMVLDLNYVNLKNEVIKAERRCLKELGFCVHVKHPHKIIITILDQLKQKHNQQLAQFAWNYVNDSFRTDVFMRFPPSVIACSCIFLAARQLQLPLPTNPPWYYLFEATDEQVEEISLCLLRLYAKPKSDGVKIEAAVVDAKRRLRDAQVKERLARDMTSQAPPSFNEHDASPQLPNSETQSRENAPPVKQVESKPVSPKREKNNQTKGRSRSKTRSRSRHRKTSSSKHSKHRRRRHSSTSPGGGHSSRSSSRESSQSSGMRRHRYENGHSKNHETKSSRDKTKGHRRSRSRSRSPSRKRDHYHHHRDRSRDRNSSHKSSRRRSPVHRSREKNGASKVK